MIWWLLIGAIISTYFAFHVGRVSAFRSVASGKVFRINPPHHGRLTVQTENGKVVDYSISVEVDQIYNVVHIEEDRP